MSKKILIGSILIFTMLLLMPSIPAIQQKIIDEGVKNDLVSPVEFNNKKNLSKIMFSKLNSLILYILNFRLNRFHKIIEFSADFIYDWHGFGHWDVHYPLIFLYSLRIFMKFGIRHFFWDYLSEKFGWNWDFPF